MKLFTHGDEALAAIEYICQRHCIGLLTFLKSFEDTVKAFVDGTRGGKANKVPATDLRKAKELFSSQKYF